MIKQVFKTMVAVLAIAAAAAGPVRAQNTMAVWPQTAYGDLQTGDTVVILDKTSAKALPSSASSTTPSTVSVTLNSAKDTLTGTPTANLLWVVTKNGNTYQFNQPGSSNYLYFIDYSNGVRVGNSNDNQFTFQIGGAYNVPFLKHNATSSYLGLNDAGEWRSAGSISNTSTIKNTVIGFYKKTVIIIPTYTARFAEGMSGWQVQDVTASASATAPAVLQNVMAGDSLVVTAPASLPGKVKSVKAVKYVPPAATVTTLPTATAALIEANSTSALVNAGTANGGTMMYAVTTTNTQPASTADFSATIPTAEGRTAGTYYVWYYAKADAEHSDSEIAGPVSVTLPVITTVTWNSTNVFNSAHRDDKILNNEWDSNPLTYEGVTISMSAFSEESVSSFKAYNEHDQAGGLTCFGDEGDSFTFTAPQGKLFCKIEIIDNGGIVFTNYGDWTTPADNKVVWSGTAASTVTLGTVYTSAGHLNSIVFKLIDAQ